MTTPAWTQSDTQSETHTHRLKKHHSRSKVMTTPSWQFNTDTESASEMYTPASTPTMGWHHIIKGRTVTPESDTYYTTPTPTWGESETETILSTYVPIETPDFGDSTQAVATPTSTRWRPTRSARTRFLPISVTPSTATSILSNSESSPQNPPTSSILVTISTPTPIANSTKLTPNTTDTETSPPPPPTPTPTTPTTTTTIPPAPTLLGSCPLCSGGGCNPSSTCVMVEPVGEMCQCPKGYKSSMDDEDITVQWRVGDVPGWVFVPTGIDCLIPCDIRGNGSDTCGEVAVSLCIN
ncbi:hypothetical protein HDU76_008944 [Blyttiomyces sp. JEL0837]|nr:hypothetical protein HDU76_008944 [Blyttiomyces sp. JEL0837]